MAIVNGLKGLENVKQEMNIMCGHEYVCLITLEIIKLITRNRRLRT